MCSSDLVLLAGTALLVFRRGAVLFVRAALRRAGTLAGGRLFPSAACIFAVAAASKQRKGKQHGQN